jgi:hypothetical protein
VAGYVPQFEGVFELGPDAGSLTDYTCDITAFVISEGRATVVKAPTAANPVTEQKAAAAFGSVAVTFAGNPGDASGLWQEMRAAMQTRTGELFFQVRYDTAAVGATNPKFTGYIVVAELNTGAPVGQVARQISTFPARDLSGPLSA